MNTSSNDGSCSKISNWEEGNIRFNQHSGAAGSQKRIIHKILRRDKPEGPQKSDKNQALSDGETRASQPAFYDNNLVQTNLEVNQQTPRLSRDLKSQFMATNGVCELSGRDPSCQPTAPVENVKETSVDHSSKKSLAERQTAYFEARRRIFEGRETTSYSQEYENAVDSEDFDVPPMTAPTEGFYTPEYFGSADCHEFYINQHHHGTDPSAGLTHLHPPVAFTAVPQGIHTVHHSWSCYWPHHPHMHEERSPHPRHA
eukprot:GHVP01015117.1.p1 GENE.GHVP01015117.1~~GHVP01015117.1.p1  ORF type:complete len:257 (-),score=29.92 GHVP01015117.1:64-834(-)